MKESGEPSDRVNGPEPSGELAPTPTAGPQPERERSQSLEQWLARIPETAPGFLREKFLREYRRNPPDSPEGPPW